MSDTLYPAPFITLSVEDLLFIVEGRNDKYSSVLCDDILPLNRTRKSIRGLCFVYIIR